MFKSLRYRILLWFVLLTTVLIVILFPLNYFHEKDKTALNSNIKQFNTIQLLLFQDQIAIGNFLNHETNNENFFITGESEYLSRHYQLGDSIQNVLQMLEKDSRKLNREVLACIDSIQNFYWNNNRIVDSIVYRTYQRGYKNFGLIGELSSYVYQLGQNNWADKNYVNQIQLYANSYYHIGDTHSAKLLLSMCKHEIKQSTADKKEALQNYVAGFYQLMQLDNLLGLHNASAGLKLAYLKSGEQIAHKVQQTVGNAETINQHQLARLNIYYGVIAVVLILASLYFSVRTSRNLVQNLEKLTSYISDLTTNKFQSSFKLDFKGSTIEVQKIYAEFRNMLAQLRVNEKMRDRAIAEAEENHLRYRELADLLPISVYETDELGNLSYVNRAWNKTFQYTPNEVVQGINLIEIIKRDRDNQVQQHSDERMDFVATRKDGSKFPVTVFSDVIKQNGRVIGRRGIIIDNTLKNQYIESLKKETIKAITSDKHKSLFLANMSHEIRTPMNSIIGFANLLSDEQLPDVQKREFTEHIQTSSDFLLKLIDDIIDIAKIEAGEIKTKKAPCNPHNLIEEVAAAFEETKGKQNPNVQLVKQLQNENLSLYTDEFRLRQILTNLLSNAYKFTEKGTITLQLGKKNERMLEFVVEDTGIGMTREELNIIFERFKRTKTTEDKKISGTGLGLAISKNLVELLGGQMWVSSEKDKGTRFVFELPYIRVSKPLPTKSYQSGNNLFSFDWGNHKILVVEDDDDNRKFLKSLLSKTNIEVIEASNGREGIEAINFYTDLDLVLMDLQMPVLNGYDAIKVIKKHFPNLPIIAQSALAMDYDKEKAYEYGCDDFITKPIQIELLLNKIDQFIEPKKPADKKFNKQVGNYTEIRHKN